MLVTNMALENWVLGGGGQGPPTDGQATETK